MAKLLRERSGGKVVKIKSLRRGRQNTPASVENRILVRHPITMQRKKAQFRTRDSNFIVHCFPRIKIVLLGIYFCFQPSADASSSGPSSSDSSKSNDALHDRAAPMPHPRAKGISGAQEGGGGGNAKRDNEAKKGATKDTVNFDGSIYEYEENAE